MQINKQITALVLVIVLHQPVATALSLLRLGKVSPVSPAWAEEAPSTPAMPPPQQDARQPRTLAPLVDKIQSSPSDTSWNPDTFGPKWGFVDRLHGGISHGILSTAGWLDSFFEDERMLKEENHSYVRIRYDVFQEEKTRLTFQQPSFDLRLRLPELQKKTHLVFSTEPAAPPQGAPASTSTTGAQVGTPEERNVTAALHYIYRTTVQESFIIRSGTQFTHGRPVLFIAPRYRSLIPFKVWSFRFTQEAIYRTDTEWQTETLLDLERQLPHDLFFRGYLDGVWMAGTIGYFYNLGCSLRQPFDPTHAVQYEWNNGYQTRPSYELTEIAFRIRYRHSFWRDWLFFEVAPQCRFPRDRNFETTPGILFRLEMFFGGGGIG